MLQHVLFRSLIGISLAFAVLILLLPTPNGQSEAEPNSSTERSNAFAIEQVRLFDGTEVFETATLVIEDGIIAALGEGALIPDHAECIDGRGMTVLPGLIDAHTHTYGAALEDSLRFGVTTNLDMFMSDALLADARTDRERIAPTQIADVYSAGTLATVAGGHGTQFGLPIETLTGPDMAADWVAARKAAGSDYIKLVYIPNQTRIPSLDLPTARALIAAAHSEGLMAVAHISTERAALDMLDAGIDGLVHLFADVAVSDVFIAKAVAADIFIIPTLAVLASVGEPGAGTNLAEDTRLAPYLTPLQTGTLSRSFGQNIPGFDLTLALQNTAKLHAAGVPILAGSDAPNPGTTHGASLHHELALLVRAGFSPVEALVAATHLPAKRFSLETRGTLMPGARADFLVVQGNPFTDITASRDIVHIYKNGHRVQRQIETNETGAQLDTPILGRFDSALDAPDGYVWTVTNDSVMGGASIADILRTPDGTLAVTATTQAGFPYPWAGAFLTLSNNSALPRNLSGFSELTLRVKGKPGTYRVILFDRTLGGIPPTVEIEVTESWNEFSHAIADFAGFNPGAFVGLAIVAGPDLGTFQYEIDDVILK